MTVGFTGGKYNIVHTGHLEGIIAAYSMVDTLHVVLFEDPEWEAARYAAAGIAPIPAHVRKRWITQAVKGMDIHVHITYGANTMDYTEWDRQAQEVRKLIDSPIDVVFDFDNYRNYFTTLYPESRIQTMTKTVPTSTTDLLDTTDGMLNVYRSWHRIPLVARPWFTKRVAVLGAESTGKSTLVQKLGIRYNAPVLAETGRDLWAHYGGGTGTVFTPEDYLTLTHQRRTAEFDVLNQGHPLFITDTEAVQTAAWHVMYEGVAHPVLDAIAAEENYDLYLVLKTDTAFHQDGTRNFDRHTDELLYAELIDRLNGKNWHLLTGTIPDIYTQAQTHLSTLYQEEMS